MNGRNEEEADYTPCVIVALADPTHATRAGRAFRRLGCRVLLAPSGPEARRLARLVDPAAVVLDTELPDESGWLTCDKLTREQPDLRVILTKQKPAAVDPQFADFVRS